jgi:ABC-type siderophore export system fused ATPase/permease subunit
MSIPVKILVSLGLLLLGAMLFYSSAYAFSVRSEVRQPLQNAMLVLTVVGIGLIWFNRLTWAAAATAAVVLIYSVILFLAR